MYVPEIVVGIIVGAVAGMALLIAAALISDRHDKKNKK